VGKDSPFSESGRPVWRGERGSLPGKYREHTAREKRFFRRKKFGGEVGNSFRG